MQPNRAVPEPAAKSGPEEIQVSNTDGIALVTNDIRKLFIQRGIDPMGATEFEQGIYRAIDIIARAVQDGDIAAYEETA